MKHSLSVTIGLILFFIVVQLASLGLFLMDIHTATITRNNESIVLVYHPSTAMGARPTQRDLSAILYIAVLIAISTIIALFIIRFKHRLSLKLFFFLAFLTAIAIALGVLMNHLLAILLAALLSFIIIKYPNPLTINISQLLSIPGIVVLLAPLFKPIYAFLLLVIISIYDYISVNYTKHMITLATNTKDIPLGVVIPYNKEQWISKVRIKKRGKSRVAMLGGGDLAFPALLMASFAQYTFLSLHTKLYAFLYSLPILIGSVAGLVVLLWTGKKNKFYPAMPFLTIGSGIGLLISYLLL